MSRLPPHIIGMLLYDLNGKDIYENLILLLPHIIGVLIYDFRTRPSANEPK